MDPGKDWHRPTPRARSEEVGGEVNVARRRRYSWCWVLLEMGEGLARKLRQGDLDKNFSGVVRTKDGCEWVKGK